MANSSTTIKLAGSTILEVSCFFYTYSPIPILKLGTDESAAITTQLAHDILGQVVLRINNPISIHGRLTGSIVILMTRPPGEPLVKLWSTLNPGQRAATEKSLVELLASVERDISIRYLLLRPCQRVAICSINGVWTEKRTRLLPRPLAMGFTTYRYTSRAGNR